MDTSRFSDIKAVILAGGKGTRLGELTKEIPKPMVPLAGKPLLQYQVEWAKKEGIHSFIFIVNHLHQPILDHFGDGADFGVKIEYYVEETPLGTVGGLKEIEAQLKDTFLVLYGDVMMDMDLGRLVDFHRSKKAEATLVLHPNDHPYDSDLVEIDENARITAFHSKPHDENAYYRNLVNAGAYLFEPSILSLLNKAEKADFGKDIFPKIFQSHQLFGYNTPEYLKDMGTPDRLELVERHYLSGRIARFHLSNKRAAIFLDRDGCINEEVSFVTSPEELLLYPYSAEAIHRINKSEYLAILATNQSAIARNLIDDAGLRRIHNKMETELGRSHAFVDAIYYCPHHPHGGFPGENAALKIDCHCRKPKSGMLLDAAAAYHIDLHNSWMIGDTERDVLAGKGAGCRTIGLYSGMGLKGAHTSPDYMMETLKHAVDFIIDEPLKPVLEQLLERYKQHLADDSVTKPFVINIGGNTRSGKSTLASYLLYALKEMQLPVQLISLDNWILPKPARDEANSVFERFNMIKLVKDIQALMQGATLEMTTYMHHPESKGEKVLYQIPQDKKQMVIIEGVVAISMPQLRGISSCKIFRALSPEKLRQRFIKFYTWKGYDMDYIEKVYAKRKADEYDLIDEDAEFAHILVAEGDF
jgi:histidinol-phosphate phosphatase family protein